MRQVSLFAVTLLFSAASLVAQDFPRVEAFGGYTYVRGGVFSATNLNGWNGNAAFNLNKWLGIVADVGGFYGSNTFTRMIPAGVVPCPPSCTVGSTMDTRVYTVLFGPRLSYRSDRFTPFVHLLFGTGHQNSAGSLIGPFPPPFNHFNESQTSFSYAAGGGVDYNLSRRLAWRGQVDYLQTRMFGTQNNVRVSTGIVFRFGE